MSTRMEEVYGEDWREQFRALAESVSTDEKAKEAAFTEPLDELVTLAQAYLALDAMSPPPATKEDA